MEKLTLSIIEKKKIDWAKRYAKANHTSVSRLFEGYIDMLMAFDQKEVKLSESLEDLRQPGKRPGSREIEDHLSKRRKRAINPAR